MSALTKVHPRESKLAKEVLAEFREPDGSVNGINLNRADRLEQAICEALVKVQEDAKS
jgi:hypothetical protein